MSRMLLSIKPEYVNKIVAGKKKYEFRKFHCREDVDTIVIYATAPVKQVIGEVSIISIIEDAVDEQAKLNKNMIDAFEEVQSISNRLLEISNQSM